jgi:hypothetical protein
LREEEGRRKQKNRLTLRPMGKHTAGKIRKIPSRHVQFTLLTR